MLHMILCGGSGTRLWPLSRECKPKQFINFLDSKSLFQRTALGNENLCDGCVIICNKDHYYTASKQLLASSITPIYYILEPIPKNTAAAVCLGLLAIDPQSTILITPADHYIEYSDAYFTAIRQAKEYAEKGYISIFGITPSKAETGFGYIETSDKYQVQCFHEKPNLETAQDYLKRGCFFWNSGIICAKAKTLLKAMQNYAPDILATSQAAFKKSVIMHSKSTIYSIPHEDMQKIPTLSIDCAILEKTSFLRCVIGSFVWNDLGSFDSLFNYVPKDLYGNATYLKNYISINSKNNLIIGNHRTISTIDLEDLVVVDTPDALLISRLGSTQKVREEVHRLGDLTKYKSPIEEQNPFGIKETSKTECIVLSPGKQLSLHKHLYRNEYLIILAGTALVNLGEAVHTLTPNQSIFIPQGKFHQVENPDSTDLVMIEVQYGSYIGEEDILTQSDILLVEENMTGNLAN